MTLVLALVLLATVALAGWAARPAARALSRARRRAEATAHRRAVADALASLRRTEDEQAVEVSDPALGAGCGRVVVDDGPWPVEVARERSRR